MQVITMWKITWMGQLLQSYSYAIYLLLGF
jgi:hypothetical protein